LERRYLPYAAFAGTIGQKIFIPVAAITFDMLENPGGTSTYNGAADLSRCTCDLWAGASVFHQHQDLNRFAPRMPSPIR